MRIWMQGLLAAIVTGTSHPAVAELRTLDERGFVSHHEVRVAASPAEVWEEALRPAGWWSDEHTYSGSAANLTITPAAGGCFCEAIPATDGRADGQIEHMRVNYLAPGSTLRMTGGLGPLQSEAVTGVLTMTIEPAGGTTAIAWEYVVGGYLRVPTDQLAPLVDRVIAEQLARLAARFAGR